MHCRSILSVVLLASATGVVDATISPALQNYISQHPSYRGWLNHIARLDLGGQGSYGGGNHVPGTKTRNTPVVIVHGAGTTAGTTQPARNYFLTHGYTDEEVYATTYANGQAPRGYACDYIKAVRTMIIIVSAYTSSTVNVVGYSMGVPLSRKAILGGRCVDTGEDLGPTMTYLVDNYVSVVGVNNGCVSQFHTDINARQRYEASQKIFSIIGRKDAIGYISCGRKVALVPGSDAQFERDTGHIETAYETIPLQYDLVKYSRPNGSTGCVTSVVNVKYCY
ncbi:Protein LIPS-17 [Aphelenchoides avenae]|nr:Protein LIPS-17 [Aphelenchus avenae]